MTEPFFPWVGGKRKLAKHILPLFPEHTCYVEPFAGAAAIFFLKEPSKVEILNDLNGELVNLYRVIQNHLEEFVRHFKWALVSREMHALLKRSDPSTLTDIQRASRFYYLQKSSFGARAHKPAFGTATTTPPRLNLLRIEEDLSQAHLRLSRVTIENLPWRKLIERYDRPHTLFYMDPPYFIPKIEDLYGFEFGLDQFEQMASAIKGLAGRAVVSVNDTPEIRRVFSGLKVRTKPVTYTLNSYTGGGKKTRELIITNW